MTHLSIDIETYSSVSIYDSGAYKYARSKDFEIMLFVYSIDFGEVTVIDLAQGQVIPDSIVAALSDPGRLQDAYRPMALHDVSRDVPRLSCRIGRHWTRSGAA